ncbi:MAG: hypothetical protein HY900_02820 [Deltaproteobacteria bacterium]|nr:hypothetical protein [Deltaproteobacteria bacterium]
MDAPDRTKYTCAEYREEMRLLGLKRRLQAEHLSDEERDRLEAEVASLEHSTRLG